MNEAVHFPRLTTEQVVVTLKALEMYINNAEDRDYYTAHVAAGIIAESRTYPADQSDVILTSEEITTIQSAMMVYGDYLVQFLKYLPNKKRPDFHYLQETSEKLPTLAWKLEMLKGE